MRTTTTTATAIRKETEAAVISSIALISRPNYISVSVNSVLASSRIGLVTVAGAILIIILVVVS